MDIQKLFSDTIKLVVFDWDGTLSNSGAVAYEHGDSHEFPPLFAQVKSLLDTLKSRGYFLAVATSMSNRSLALSLAHHQLTDYFDKTATSSEYFNKPNPEMLIAILDHLGVDYSEAIMVGDTASDIEMAQNAGVKVIAVATGHYELDELEPYDPDALVKDLGVMLNDLLGQA